MVADLGAWITTASSILSGGYVVGSAINGWRDKRIRELERQVSECQRRDKRHQEDLMAAWEYIRWLQTNSRMKPGAPPAPAARGPREEAEGEDT
jgi:hypothetical protein